MIREYDNALHLPAKYYAPIGEFIFRWAQLEYQMQEIIWRSLGIDNKMGRTLTVGMNATTLAAILNTLTLQWLATTKEKEAVRDIAKGVRELREFRNQLSHGSWEYPKGGKRSDVYLIYMKETAAQRILPRAVKHEPQEIKSNAGKMKRLNENAQKLIHHLDKRQTP